MHNKRRQNTTMNGGAGGGQHRHNNNNRPRRFNNNRPQHEGGNDAASISRTRRNATQNREKYQMMARDAMSSGDRVLNEYYLQHADHYHRVLLALPPEEAPRPQYLRGHNPNEQQHGQEPQGQTAQEGQTPHSHAGNGHGNGAVDEHTQQVQPSQDHGHGLPSFITQSQAPEEPRE